MSFRLKTILGVALIEAILLMVLVFTSLDFLSRSNEVEIDKRARSTVALFATTVKNGVLSTDLASLDAFVKDLLTNPGIVYVRIRNADKTLAQGGVIKDAGAIVVDQSVAEATDGVYDISAPITESGYPFGQVEIGLSVNELGNLIDDARVRFLSIASLELIFVAVFSYLLGSYLTRALRDLKQASLAIIDGASNIQVPVSGSDEIADTARAFNAMSERISKEHEGMRKSLEISSTISISLQESNLRLKAILNGAIDGILTFDEAGIIIDANPMACHLFGYWHDNILGLNVAALLPTKEGSDEQDDAVDSQLARLIAMVGTSRQCNGCRRDGTTFPIDLSVSEVRLLNRRVFVGLIRDITESNQIQSEMARSRIIHSATISASLDGLITIDLSGTILEFSAAAEAIFGYRQEDVIGKYLEECIIPEPMRAMHRRGLEHFRKTGTGPIINKRIEIQGQHKNGEPIPIEMAIVPIQIGSDTLFTAFIRDIRERKAHEAELEQARILAEHGSEAKSRFLATMSHEIRSPLNAVLGSVNLLLDTPLNKEQLLYSHTARDAGRALLSTINDILDFSKIEAGHLTLEQIAFSPSEIVDDVLHILSSKAESKGIDLVACIQKEVPAEVIGDPTRLRQVLINLVDNAVKFSNHGAVSVQIRVRERQDQSVELVFEVQDEGAGIPDHLKADLFEEFTQADASHSTRHGGTGLGLAICRRLVELMSGTLEVDSDVGAGSCFRFNALVSIADSNAHNESALFPVNANVMILHPDQLVRRLLVDQYQELGATALSAANYGQLDIRNYSGPPINALLIDDRLIHEFTASIIAEMRKYILAPDAIIAAMTFFVSSEVTSRLQEIGFDQTVKKPLTRAVLIAVMGPSEHAAEESTENVAGGPAGEQPLFHPKARILLAEDSAANQIVAGAILRRAGYEVSFVNNGRQAVESAQHSHYDLILMDIRMPDMDGLQATRCIRELNLSKEQLPIIALTANVQQEDVDQCLLAGMNDFVSKPVDAPQLIKVITAWLDQTAGARTTLSEAVSDPGCLINKEALENLANETSHDAIPLMLNAYINETRERLTLIQGISLPENLEELEDAAHALKGSAGTFGAARLHAQARELELECRNKNAARAGELVGILVPLAEQTLDAMARYCRQHDEADPAESA